MEMKTRLARAKPPKKLFFFDLGDAVSILSHDRPTPASYNHQNRNNEDHGGYRDFSPWIDIEDGFAS